MRETWKEGRWSSGVGLRAEGVETSSELETCPSAEAYLTMLRPES